MLWCRESLVGKATRWEINLYITACVKGNAVGINGSALPRQGEIGASGAKVHNGLNVTCLHRYFLYISYNIQHCLHTVYFLSSLTSKYSGCGRCSWHEWNWRSKGESAYDKMQCQPRLLTCSVYWSDGIVFGKSAGQNWPNWSSRLQRWSRWQGRSSGGLCCSDDAGIQWHSV